MRAAVIYENGGPGVLRFEEVPEPECPDGCVIVDAEAISIEGGDLLARAVGNLVSNAIKYSPAGTEVTVAVRAEPGGVAIEVGPWRTTLQRDGHGSRTAVLHFLLQSLELGKATVEDAPMRSH